MAADDGLGLDNDEDVSPPRPEAAQASPEQPIEGNLLAQGEHFEGRVAASAEEDADSGQR